MTGDLVARRRAAPAFAAAAADLAAAARHGAFAVLGNHDLARARDPFAQGWDAADLGGLTLLDGDAAEVVVSGRRICIAGASADRIMRDPEYDPAVHLDVGADLRVLLCHFPRVLRRLETGWAHLVLAGISTAARSACRGPAAASVSRIRAQARSRRSRPATAPSCTSHRASARRSCRCASSRSPRRRCSGCGRPDCRARRRTDGTTEPDEPSKLSPRGDPAPHRSDGAAQAGRLPQLRLVAGPWRAQRRQAALDRGRRGRVRRLGRGLPRRRAARRVAAVRARAGVPARTTLPAGPASDDAVLVTCAYLWDPSSPWSLQSLFLACIGACHERRVPAIEAFGFVHAADAEFAERFLQHRTIFPRDFLADYGFYTLRSAGRVELMRLELGGLQPVAEDGRVAQAVRRAAEIITGRPPCRSPRPTSMARDGVPVRLAPLPRVISRLNGTTTVRGAGFLFRWLARRRARGGRTAARASRLPSARH